MKAIHQIVAGYTLGDAISNEVRQLRKIFRSWGHPSEIYCESRSIHPELRTDARDLPSSTADFQPDDIALLHLSIGSDLNDLFATLPCKKAILYHNITPPSYFHGLQEHVAALLDRGLRQARALAGSASVVMADSAFNAREIEAMGHPKASVLPLVLDFSTLRSSPDRRTLRKFRDGHINVLFVGRCAPNKRIEDLLNAFHFFQRYVRPDSQFIHVGSFVGMEQYHALLSAHAKELQLRDVHLVGAISQSELNACYKAADLFLCLSDHEGFCIPLLEAMAHDVPVLAYDSGAVAETLGGAGVLFREKRYDLIAETMGRVANSAELREAILRGQRERLARYEAQDLPAILRSALSPLL